LGGVQKWKQNLKTNKGHRGGGGGGRKSVKGKELQGGNGGKRNLGKKNLRKTDVWGK